ncbi:hypothetical protein DC522_12900 [Microvirga sp. KLBC 81]|uniref:Uncharacterized protein n=1 Tax=Microvirga vignae TaxID=1225564 RepID=A0A0H1R3N6_9HYPH|nr:MULTISPECIES: hypothetical protein [Microvirga]KLK89758.1 hypothetical protein AA309_29605 [Microvirga vignae]PVE23996.1 hypothetical protein DC522_12900 [Microvirga sp. KLBC 81]
MAARLVANFQNQLNFLKVFPMHQTEVAAPALPPGPAPTFTAAAIRFVASLAALIGVSLLLASPRERIIRHSGLVHDAAAGGLLSGLQAPLPRGALLVADLSPA